MAVYSRRIPIILRFGSDREEWQKNAKQYRELGMTDEQIKAIKEFDDKKFKADRAYYEKKVSLDEADVYESMNIDELLIDNVEENWHEYIPDAEKRKKLANVPTNMRKAFYLNKVDKLSQQKISSILLIPRRTIGWWIVKIAEILK